MANLLSTTTVGGNSVITTANVGTYAITSLTDTLATVTARGATTSTRIDLGASESMRLYGIRGRFTNEYIHLYHKVGVGHPSGWGQGESDTPGYGLSTYGGINIAYGNLANSIFNGKVGIGTNSPSTKLHVVGGDSDGIRVSGGTNNRYVEVTSTNIDFYTTSVSGYGMANLVRKNSDGSVLGQISGAFGDPNTLTYTYYGGTAYNNAAMYILSSNNNVGIGTTSPAAQLHVYSSGNGEIEVQRASGALINLQAQASLAAIGTDSNHPLYLKTNSATRAAILTNGNVGIGTISPDQKLHVSGNTKTTNLYVAGDIIHDGDADTKIQFNTDIINFDTAGVERLRITAGGDIGIGTTSPDSIVHAEQAKQTLSTTNLDNGTAVGLHLTYPDTTLTGGEGIALAMGMNGRGRSYIANLSATANKDASDMLFYTENGGVIGERMRINSYGSVGIGTSSPARTLHVKKTGDNEVARFESDQTTSYIELEDANTTGQILIGTQGDNFKIHTAGSERLRINGSGHVGIGTSSPATKLHVNGTFASNALWTDSSGVSYWGNYSTAYGGLTWDTGQATVYATSGKKLHLSSDGSSPDVTIDTSGNVLIGTTTDLGYKLRVDGSALFTNWVRVNGDDGIYFQDRGGGWRMTDTTWLRSYNDKSIYTGGGAYFGGNVGIGTTSPSQDLHVVGNIAATGSRLNFLVKEITVQGSPQGGTYKGYILLAKAYTTGTVAASYAMGKIYVRRGTATTGLNLDIYEVTSSTGYNGEQLTINVIGSQSPRFIKTCKVTYGGVVYHAIESSASGGEPSTELTFEGVAYDAQLIMTDESYVSSVTAYGNLATTTDSSGKVGIGTSSPSKTLSVVGSPYEPISWQRTSGTTGYLYSDGSGVGMYTGTSFSQAGIYMIANTSMDFRVNGVQRMYINSSGNVGIGTTSPDFKLDVAGDIGIDGKIYHNGDHNTYIGFTGDVQTFRTGGSDRVTINNTALTLSTTASNQSIVYWGTNTAYEIRGGGNYGYMGYNTGGYHSFMYAGTELMRLTSSGNVGIGTSSPSYKLHVSGNAYINETLFVNQLTTIEDSLIVYDNVGIGTTSPSYKLDVSGTARAVKSKIDITPTSNTTALDIRGTGTPNDFFTVSNATGGANDVFLPIFFYKAATYGYNGGTNRYPSGVYGGGFVAAVDDTSYPSAAGAGAAMHFNSRTYANNGPLTNRYLFSWGSWLTTHMAMTAGGNLLIGTTTDSGYKLDVNGDINANGDYYANGTQGYTGTVTIQQPSPNPPINIDIQGGIITNVY